MKKTSTSVILIAEQLVLIHCVSNRIHCGQIKSFTIGSTNFIENRDTYSEGKSILGAIVRLCNSSISSSFCSRRFICQTPKPNVTAGITYNTQVQ